MSATPTIGIYESTFAQSDKTDAILVVDEKKLHVNRALLSYHSEYFKTLFNTDSDEKSPPEFPIPDVYFEHFATVLSFTYKNPLCFHTWKAEEFLEIADQFQLTAAKRFMEFQLMLSTGDKKTKIQLADKFKLNELFNHTLFDSKRDYLVMQYDRYSQNYSYHQHRTFFESLSNESNVKLFHQLVKIMHGTCEKSAEYELKNNYESAFAISDKTDAILAVGEKKLHVNKAVLSYHSEYFNALFNGEFKEKSMKEIQINDVDFEDFTALLSLIQHNPILPTENNAENLLELADRFLLLSSVKHLLELLLTSPKIDRLTKLRIADKYKLDDLLAKAFVLFNDFSSCNDLMKLPFYDNLSDDTKIKLFYHMLQYVKE